MEIKSFRPVGLVTDHMTQSLNFYKKIFGLKIAKSQIENDPSLAKIMGLKRVKIKTVKLKNDKSIILVAILLSKSKDIIKKIYSRGITHFAVTVKNIDDIIKKLEKFENCIISNSEISIDKKEKYAFCKTPEKIFIELVQILRK